MFKQLYKGNWVNINRIIEIVINHSKDWEVQMWTDMEAEMGEMVLWQPKEFFTSEADAIEWVERFLKREE